MSFIKDRPSTYTNHAIVIGGSMAGLLAGRCWLTTLNK